MVKVSKSKKSSKEEILDMITEDDEVIGTITRKEAIKGRLLHRGIFIMVFNGNGDLFLQLRPNNKEVYPNHWSISCSGYVKSEETYEDAAERELKEELGIDVPLNYITRFRYKDKFTNYIGHLFAVEYELPVKPNKKEVKKGKYVSKNELMKIIKKKNFCPDDKKMVEMYYEEAKKLATG